MIMFMLQFIVFEVPGCLCAYRNTYNDVNMMHTSYLNLVLTRRQGENNKFGIYSNDKLQVDLIK